MDKLEEVADALRLIQDNFDPYVDITHNQMMLQLLGETKLNTSNIVASFLRFPRFQPALASTISTECATATFESVAAIEFQRLAQLVCATY